MKINILLTVLFFLLFGIKDIPAQKIGKRIKNAAKQTTEQKAEEKTTEGVSTGIDKGIDAAKSIFKKKKSKSNKNDDEETEGDGMDEAINQPGYKGMDTTNPETATAFGVYTKFTFEPGNKIVFYEDFNQEQLGDFPLNWETNSSGEVVSNSVYEGKWFSLSGRAGYMPATGELPENYTIEFDIVTMGLEKNNAPTSLTLAFLNKKAYSSGAVAGHAFFKMGMSSSAGMYVGNTGPDKTPRIQSSLNRKFKVNTLVHFSVAVNKSRLRVWMEEEKIVDIPSLLVSNLGRYLLFETYGVDRERGHVVLLSNFKIAEAKEDLRSRLLDEGRFSTTGIYFNTDKADIKPESFAIIKSVADYLKENPDVHIQIIGHTDAQGEDSYNLQLSERRAEAVKQALINQFQIEETRITSLGKGESEPVDDNETINGRANNRRVEFIKN
ncbi:MAG: OmpA family protein [Terrimonas sp.]|nr:OmpA family protein [Terrimonas sp.]